MRSKRRWKNPRGEGPRRAHPRSVIPSSDAHLDAGLRSAIATPAAQQSIDIHCTGPKGSPWTIAPEIIATTGTMTAESPAILAGSKPTIANQATLPSAMGTSVM